MAASSEGGTRMKRWTINFVTGAFAVALALLYVLVLRSIAVQIVSPPEALMEPYPDTSTEELCQAAGGRWVTRGAAPGGHESAPVDEDSPPYCQGPLAFEREREAQAEKSRQISLFVFAIGGGVAVAASLMVSLLRPVAPGLMLGGIAAFFIAGVHIWTLAPGLGRLVTIVVIFVALVSIGLYALREEHTS